MTKILATPSALGLVPESGTARRECHWARVLYGPELSRKRLEILKDAVPKARSRWIVCGEAESPTAWDTSTERNMRLRLWRLKVEIGCIEK